MNREARAEFERLVEMEAVMLNPTQLAFLKARRSYMNEAELERFGLVEKPAPKKKSKKKSKK